MGSRLLTSGLRPKTTHCVYAVRNGEYEHVGMIFSFAGMDVLYAAGDQICLSEGANNSA